MRTLKNIVLHVCLFATLLYLISCDSKDAIDCFQTSGSIVQEDVEVLNFERILVNRDIELIIKQADEIKVTIETGENLLNDVTAEVVDNQLVLTDKNTCNFVRNFGITKVYIEVPNLTEIRSSTQFDIRSEGILNFPNLRLLSENFNDSDIFTVGDFRLNVMSESINVISNGLAFFYLSGDVNMLSVNFFAGDGRFEGRDLIVQHVNVFHRGSNDMVINAQQSLTGRLVSTGNLISVNRPVEVDIKEAFNGRLIFE